MLNNYEMYQLESTLVKRGILLVHTRKGPVLLEHDGVEFSRGDKPGETYHVAMQVITAVDKDKEIVLP